MTSDSTSGGGSGNAGEPADAVPGAIVLATRVPERAGELAAALHHQGLDLVLSPLRAPRALTEPELEDLAAGLFSRSWEAVAFTSVNGLRGLRAALERLHARGRTEAATPAQALAGAAVHCVGRATAGEARAQGLRPQEPDTAPAAAEEQSARGLLARLARTGVPSSVLCVHGEPHRPELAAGLRELGATVGEAVSYAMTDWPAEHPLTGAPAATPMPVLGDVVGDVAGVEHLAVLDREGTRVALREGRPDVVLATSPDLLRRLHELGTLPQPVVCLGRTTGETAQDLGLAYVVAASPAPQDLAEAARTALAGGPQHTADRTASPEHRITGRRNP